MTCSGFRNDAETCTGVKESRPPRQEKVEADPWLVREISGCLISIRRFVREPIRDPSETEILF